VFALEAWAGGLGALALWIVLREPGILPRRARLFLIAPGALSAVGLLQLAPLPSSWTWLGSPAATARRVIGTVVPEAALGSSPWSLSPPDTVDALLRLAAYALIGLAAFVSLREERHVRQAAALIAVSGAFQALYGSAEYLSGHQHIFGFAKTHYLSEATGTFINRNHFAGYLAMTLPFSLGLAIASLGRPRGREGAEGLRKALRDWLDSTRPAALLAAGAALVTWTGVILSYSRAGLAAAVLASATSVIVLRLDRRRAIALVVALAIPLLSLLWLEIRAPGERFAAVGNELSSRTGRLAVWRTTVDLIGAHPLLGYGLGTFESAYGPHRAFAARIRYDHAHNDWLEALLEGGIGAVLVLAGLLGLAVRPAFAREGRASERSGLAKCAAGGVLAIALHSLTDFCLRIPAIAVLLAVLLAILAREGERSREPEETIRFPVPPARDERTPTPRPTTPRSPRTR